MKGNSQTRIVSIVAVLILVQLACSLTAGTPGTESPANTGAEQTLQAQAVQLEGTRQAMAFEQTLAVMGMEQTAQAMQSTQDALSQPTTEPPTQQIEPTAQPLPSETPDPSIAMAEKIKNAKVLLFEDTIELGIGQWIEDTLKRMGLEYTSTLDYSGEFMQHLDSGEKWDLIIVGAENHTAIQGEFWDALVDQANKKVAIIAEVWYVDLLGGGKMRNFMGQCGISYDSNWDLAESIYWVKPDHEIFNYPNTALPLLHYSRYWAANAGDKVRLRSTGDAEIVAGITKFDSKSGGLITVCMEGRTVFQTFCNHDFHKDEIMDLYENFITYTLTNHFNSIGQ
jgi:hypothetical protein